VSPTTLLAQIYADITLREGESPLGTFRVLLHETEAPRAVANFIGLARGSRNWIDPATGAIRIGVPFYTGLRVHRLDHDFVLQGGDPLGTGAGGPGYVFQDQFHPNLRHDGPYKLSMAHSGPHSNGSQFFITLADTSFLDDLHTVFGTVINDATYPNSRALIDGFTSEVNFPTDDAVPLSDIIIDSIAISGPGLDTFDPSDTQWGLPQVHGIQLALRPEATDSVYISFEANPRHEYPLYTSQNLAQWTRPGTILNLNPTGEQEIDVTGVVGPRQTFFTLPVVEYTHLPHLPQNIFADGVEMILQANGGTLTLAFTGTGGGTWRFEDAANTITSGLLTNVGVPENTLYPGLPTEGLSINNQGSWARALAAREITIYFDGPEGPDLLTAIQPIFSFHTETGGWYNGPVMVPSLDPVRKLLLVFVRFCQQTDLGVQPLPFCCQQDNVKTPDHMKRPIAYFGHHKCASSWILTIVNQACKDMGLRHKHFSNTAHLQKDANLFISDNKLDFVSYTNSDYNVVRDMTFSKAFHVIRDPRDLITSAYFSHKKSHTTKYWPELIEHRKRLNTLSKEKGLEAEIQFSRRFLDEIQNCYDQV
ncbi:MAG: peptidylprolyl isomerase, partial [Kiritimatiellae bacterium]|nr:peptidylprolyl isomerase [Kiritimatiellia bacterium]